MKTLTQLTSSLALATVLGLAPNVSFAQSSSGSVDCTSPGKPDLKFSPQTAAGYFVKKSGAFNLTFFADRLSNEELRYWVASEVSYRDGKFEGKEFENDLTKDRRNEALRARSVQVWGELKDHSKHEENAYPAVHSFKDFKGMQLTACSNFGYLNAGLGEDDVEKIFQVLNVPTPAGAAAPQKVQADFKYSWGKAGASRTDIKIKGEPLFFVVHE